MLNTLCAFGTRTIPVFACTECFHTCVKHLNISPTTAQDRTRTLINHSGLLVPFVFKE